MGFKSLYRSTDARGSCARRLLNEKQTILPFFDFTYHQFEIEGADKSEAGLSRADERSNGRRKRASGAFGVEFSRSESTIGRAKELEDRVLDLLSQDPRFQDSAGNFDPFKTPYLSPSLYDFYNDKSLYMKKLWSVFALFLLPFLGSMIWLMVDLLRHTGGHWGIALGGCAYLLAWGLAYGLCKVKRRKGSSFFVLSPKERRQVQDLYLASLEIGIEEVDELLKEYAHLTKSIY